MTDIVLIEDNRYVREGWLAVLSAVPEFQVVGSFASCEEAFQSEQIAEADVVLMDIGLPGMSGVEGVKVLTQRFSHIAVIMCTVFEEEEKIFDSLCSGAIGYLLKKIPAEDLIQAIKTAVDGGSPMTPNIARKVIRSFRAPERSSKDPSSQLTERETEVLNLLAQGKSYAEIGKALFLSVDGVRYHIRHIYQKLHVHSSQEAVARGLKARIIRPPR